MAMLDLCNVGSAPDAQSSRAYDAECPASEDVHMPSQHREEV